jgi:glutamate synthase (NADPH/NADH) large chain/glutamate synthase (ferredoxin)
LNGLRNRVRIETDGQLKTGRDVAIAALLGAEEYGFATAPLIVEGCLMMRKCHLNTCPVGIATQDPVLRAKFAGKPEHLVNYFFFVAEELRAIMAELGFRTIDEMVGRADRLRVRSLADHWKASGLDLSPLFYMPKPGDVLHRTEDQVHGLEAILDQRIWRAVEPALARGETFQAEYPVSNTDRSVGAFLSGRITKRSPLADGAIRLKFRGSAGQSFGAFLVQGISVELEGEGNDYVGKGLSGGRISVYAPAGAAFSTESSILVGNTCVYGATAGEVYVAGLAGERFAVRNSGAIAVVEGVGDHGCEYMTGGRVVVLGPTGRNFAAGMSGGLAYVYDEQNSLRAKCNLGIVELEALDSDDLAELEQLVSAHAAHTGSPKARALLADWAVASRAFKKIIPTDYKGTLAAARARANPGVTLV